MKRIAALILASAMSLCAFSEGIGLVLSGGGAKGAYQVGVWKAMNEYGLDKKTHVISGTSVGGLNAALFSCCTTEQAEELWKNEVGYSSFLMPDATSIEGIKNYIRNYTGQGSPILDYFTGNGSAAGLFERNALESIFQKYVTLDALNKSGKKVYVTALHKENLAANAGVKGLASLFSSMGLIDNVPQDYTDTFLLNDQLSSSNVRSLLMATSALPLVYPSQTLAADVVLLDGTMLGDERNYIDGGFEAVGGNNVPVGPVVQSTNLDTMFIVYLKSENELDGKVDLSAYSGKVVEFIPSADLGDMLEGTLNFSEEKIEELIQLGYEDASRTLEENGYRKSFFRRIGNFFYSRGRSIKAASSTTTFAGIPLYIILAGAISALILVILLIVIVAKAVSKSRKTTAVATKKRNSKSHPASRK